MPLRRLPELWCGDDRETGKPPVDYHGTRPPQARPAGAACLLVAPLLVLESDAPSGRRGRRPGGPRGSPASHPNREGYDR